MQNIQMYMTLNMSMNTWKPYFHNILCFGYQNAQGKSRLDAKAHHRGL